MDKVGNGLEWLIFGLWRVPNSVKVTQLLGTGVSLDAPAKEAAEQRTLQ